MKQITKVLVGLGICVTSIIPSIYSKTIVDNYLSISFGLLILGTGVAFYNIERITKPEGECEVTEEDFK